MVDPDPQPDVPPLAEKPESEPIYSLQWPIENAGPCGGLIPKSETYALRLAAWEARRKHVVELREVERLRFAEIGRLLGISRQRAKKLYLKERK